MIPHAFDYFAPKSLDDALKAIGDGAKHRVDDGMQRNVGVRMAFEPARMRNGHAADDQLAALDQPVRVKTLSDSHRFSMLFSISAAKSRSCG